MRSARLLGRDHHQIGFQAAIGEGPAAISLCRGGAPKTYSYTDTNEDAALFALGEAGSVIAVADGHYGDSGSAAVIELIEERIAPDWTAPAAAANDPADWVEMALDALVACNQAVLERAGDLALPPAPTTLSLVAIRPGEDRLIHACVGDSHLFRVDVDGRSTDLALASRRGRHGPFLGYESAAGRRDWARDHGVIGCASLAGVRALVLATDGLSEAGIGVADPAAAVEEAVAHVLELPIAADPARATLALCKRIGEIAIAAQRAQQAGDNIACATLLLDGRPG